ncbi:MAG: tetratricopeptide repeat protein [Bacteroidota bacterium]
MLALLTKVSRSARRLFVCTVLILWTLVGNKALGQTLMVDQAYALLKQGELSKSQQAIDIAVEHPSTAESPKAWYLRSYIYQQLAEQKTDSTQSLRNVSITAAMRCLEIDTQAQFTQDCQSLITHAYTSFLNEAITALNNQNFPEVLPALQPIVESESELARTYRPEALFYYGYAQLQLNREDEARTYLYEALQAGYQDALIYEVEVRHRTALSQYDSAQWYLARGREQFPEDANLHIAELNFLMQQESYQEAEQSVLQYLERKPNNIEGLLLAGTIYEKLLSSEKNDSSYFAKQKRAYEQILQVNPNHVQANYNLGIAYYNRGVMLINSAAQDYEIDIVRFNQLLEECSTLFLSALPYLKKVNKLDETNVNALKALQGVYYNINDYEQYNQVKAKLQQL